MSRDLNAAINIKTAGMAGIAQQQKLVVAQATTIVEKPTPLGVGKFTTNVK